MIALDTNVIVRVLTRDDPAQAELATELMKSADIFISKTVLLELEWVLRCAYGFEPPAIHAAISRLLGLPNLSAEDVEQVGDALKGYEAGMDFADALHLCSCSALVTEFATFDRGLERKADTVEVGKPVRLLRKEPAATVS